MGPIYQYKATVIKVVDGDTIDLCIDLGFNSAITERVRLLGCNARKEEKTATQRQKPH